MSAGHRSYPLIFSLLLSIKKLKIPSEVDEVAAINLLHERYGWHFYQKKYVTAECKMEDILPRYSKGQDF